MLARWSFARRIFAVAAGWALGITFPSAQSVEVKLHLFDFRQRRPIVTVALAILGGRLLLLAAIGTTAASAATITADQVINGTSVHEVLDDQSRTATFSNACGTQVLTQAQLSAGAIPDQIVPCPRPGGSNTALSARLCNDAIGDLQRQLASPGTCEPFKPGVVGLHSYEQTFYDIKSSCPYAGRGDVVQWAQNAITNCVQAAIRQQAPPTPQPDSSAVTGPYDPGDPFDKYKTAGYKDAKCSEDLPGSLFTTGPVIYSCRDTELARLHMSGYDGIQKFIAFGCGRGDNDMIARRNAEARARDAIFKLELDKAQAMGADSNQNEHFIPEQTDLHCIRTEKAD
jgi:hypothetical protein